MKKLAILTIATFLTACGTVTQQTIQQINTLHAQGTAKFKADIIGVEAVGNAANDMGLVDCAHVVLTDQIPAIEALDNVQVTGPLSILALANAKREALKLKPSVALKCSAQGWLLGQLGLLGQAAH